MADTFAIGPNDFLLNGKPFVIRCGEMHSDRVPPEYWRNRLKICKAMGLNTVCAYLFWNIHEPREGQFNWQDSADVAAFCRIAQQEGLYVILRPGPYSCAEWEFGGFPWWLLKTPDIQLRTRDPHYIAAVKRYFMEVGRHLAPLQITHGGPIIMAQVENEYGSYGSDKEYMGQVRDMLRAAGFDVPLFHCDGPSQLPNDHRADIFAVDNFGGDPQGAFAALRKVQPSGPLMCGEYYPGWFDHWGEAHHTGDSQHVVSELKYMLDHKASFSIYMAHGGTSFGFTSGANAPPFGPTVTSYDYDAPISEPGWDTPKFHAIRELFSHYLQAGETLPPIPPRNPVIAIPQWELKEYSPLLSKLGKPVVSVHPQTLEQLDQANACVLYRATLPAGPAARLVLRELHDYALISLNGKKIATLDRRRGQASCALPARPAPAQLDILVDTFGRVNYGSELADHKGITEKVELVTEAGPTEVLNWSHFKLPLDTQSRARRYQPGKT
ncbi:MAG: beta-galactosidase, partial [Armatimonadota bacterium]|nr:beta-galactosidase [Armatimonadota bacterium]